MFTLNNKSILITGGTGSFGKKFVEIALKKYPRIKRLVVFSRDELKQFEMAQVFPERKYPNIRFFIGDVRDRSRLTRAFEGINYVIHAAALKQVPTAEYNPIECIRTNILGAENVINAAMDMGVEKVIALSTDKAAAPINLYGATKLCSDKLFVAANNMRGKRKIAFSIVRYGNVMGSRGSVIPYFVKKKETGILPITDLSMTRFNITLEEGVNLVLYVLKYGWGGEIFVPKLPSYKITDLAKAIGPECKTKIIGVRPGEKIHEEMITETDSLNTIEFKNYYVIVPTTPQWDPKKMIKKFKGKWVKKGFKYTSYMNTRLLTISDIEKLIKKTIKV
jgi:UDP-N-acetylglucosamine 4,6-dehydratase (inverting)